MCILPIISALPFTKSFELTLKLPRILVLPSIVKLFFTFNDPPTFKLFSILLWPKTLRSLLMKVFPVILNWDDKFTMMY